MEPVADVIVLGESSANPLVRNTKHEVIFRQKSRSCVGQQKNQALARGTVQG